jgi:hypothetical protein
MGQSLSIEQERSRGPDQVGKDGSGVKERDRDREREEREEEETGTHKHQRI